MRMIAAVMFLAFGAYTAAFILQKSDDVTVTEKARYAKVSESFSVKGKAYRELTPVITDDSGLVILAAEGQQISGGSAVAVKEESSDDYFAYCDYRLSKTKFLSEQAAVEAIKSGSPEVRAWAVMCLEGQKVPEKTACPEGVIYAPCAGIFAATGDGTYAVADRTKWFFSFESEKAENLRKGQKLNLKISSGSEAEAEVYGIDGCKVTLAVRSGSSFIPDGKVCGAKISVSDCRGIKIPRKAMHFDGEGGAFVYALSAGIKEKTAVEIIYTSENFYLCADTSLREGTEVIISEK